MPSRILLVVLVVALAGCGRSLMPTPNLYSGSDENPFEAVPESRRSPVVEILYATDRKPKEKKESEADDPRVTYTADRSRSLAVGVARVRLGVEGLDWDSLVEASRSKHRPGSFPLVFLEAEERLRYPRLPWYVNVVDDPEHTHETWLEDRAAAEVAFHALLREQLAASDRNDVYIFIHGFNNTLPYAAETLAELWHFLGRPGIAIAYSWPAARAGIFGYGADRESGEFTITHLKRFLRSVAACDEVDGVHIVAHSRGTDVAMTAIREIALECRGAGTRADDVLKLRNFVLAAADMDMEVTQQRYGAEGILQDDSGRVTVYTGHGDSALDIASWLFGSKKRLGQFDPDDVRYAYQQDMLRRFESLSFVHRPKKSGPFGHAYFVDDPRVSSDLILVLRDDKDPGLVNGRPLRRDPSGMWVVEDAYPYNIPADE